MDGYKTPGKMTLGERPRLDRPNELEIDCYEANKCLERGGKCHHLGTVPPSFEGMREIPGCSGTGGTPWTMVRKGEYQSSGVHASI